ncbi:MAG: lipoyl(octanoyl) transferase LipB [Saprospiraceae bacterium]|nr:lipoyl(octanoyl) transferase LipB [Saprospiraceae bacterium]MBK9631867.1 lipoyl(octanoyl) transferase LipB [Saprospiraceae bacterium]
MKKLLEIRDLGLIQYQEAWDYQTVIHQQLIQAKKTEQLNATNHVLILCEHPHVYTLGKSGDDSHLKVKEEHLAQIDADFYRINRGGDITYHGPGQLVAYPILDLECIKTDVHWYVRSLEEVVIRSLNHFGIFGERVKEYTGVWLDKDKPFTRKICAIGVHLSRWVSLHGLALNVNTNLDYFNHIIPCGIQDASKSVTSISKELQTPIDMEEVKMIFIKHFLEVFELEFTTSLKFDTLQDKL